jgi:hypothetical protein
VISDYGRSAHGGQSRLSARRGTKRAFPAFSSDPSIREAVVVRRILKALIYGWIGKKIYDYTLGAPEAGSDHEPARNHARKTAQRSAAPKRRTSKRRAA